LTCPASVGATLVKAAAFAEEVGLVLWCVSVPWLRRFDGCVACYFVFSFLAAGFADATVQTEALLPCISRYTWKEGQPAQVVATVIVTI